MKELSLNILDIAQNSVKAGADKIEILIDETEEILSITVKDNGCGMTDEFLRTVEDPFTTTRTTRKVGLGIPLFKLAAEQTEGKFSISSRHESLYSDHGTEITAQFNKKHLDFTPLGDIISTLTVLIGGSPHIRWVFNHRTEKGNVHIDTDELKAVLGDVSLDNYEVLSWIKDYLAEQYQNVI